MNASRRARWEQSKQNFRDQIEDRYKDNPTDAGNSFDEILCYEIHHGSDGEHEGGLTFRWLALKWQITVDFLGVLISDHCSALGEEQYQEALEREGKEINNEIDWNAFLARAADIGQPDNPEIGDAWIERS